jgi:hypothetical protein
LWHRKSNKKFAHSFFLHAEGDGIAQVPSSTVRHWSFLFFYMLQGMELPKSHSPLVSLLSLHAEGMILNFSIPVLSCSGHSSFFYLLKGDGIAQVASFTVQSSLFYLLKGMELPKSHPPLFSLLCFTC